MKIIQFIDKHRGVAMFLGACTSVTAGATWWLAKGGAVALVTSVTALSTPEIAETLAGLPDYTARVEKTLAAVQESQEETRRALQQISDSLEAFRVEAQQIVEWAPDHSQRLTDAVGGCFAGDSDCLVYFRGRRTQAGAGCTLSRAEPKLELADGREFPIRFSKNYTPVPLETEFRTIPVYLEIPDFIPPGVAGVVVLNYYMDCPFASRGETVNRKTFRLLLEIKEPKG